MKLLRRLRRNEGYSLTELVTVMAILSIVLGGLATMFGAGVRAEMRASREFRAQQNARLALDRMRRELHCANAITATGESITVTLPAGCQSADTSVTYATEAVSAGRWRLTRAAGAGTPVQIADYLTEDTIFTYTAPASGTLGRLSVDIVVNIDHTDTTTEWRLQDDIVLRNTTRL